MKNIFKKKEITESEILFNTVIKNNYCIGCGNCTIVKNSPFNIEWTKYGLKNITFNKKLNYSNVDVLSICPFSDKAKDENKLGNIFLSDCNKENINIGKYLNCFVGYTNEKFFRQTGTSGGFARWLGYTLLAQKEIDYFIQVVPNLSHNKDELFSYSVFKNKEDIVNTRAKSAYYPISLESAISFIKKNKGKYAITALPCFAKALRLFSLQEPIIKERLSFIIGIICGSLKSANYAKSIAWQQGVHPSNLYTIDFRVKIKNKPPYVQGNSVNDNYNTCKTNKELFGTDYGMGFFKPKACDYCDDVFAETADISLGDAWLPKYDEDDKGNSIIIIRNITISKVFKEANLDAKIHITELPFDKVVQSQEASLRHRRQGLSYRLFLKKKKKKWFPQKRVLPDNKMINERKKIYRLREKISKKSHIVFFKSLEKNDFSYFPSKMQHLVTKYKIAYGVNKTNYSPVEYIKKVLHIFGLFRLTKRVFNFLKKTIN